MRGGRWHATPLCQRESRALGKLSSEESSSGSGTERLRVRKTPQRDPSLQRRALTLKSCTALGTIGIARPPYTMPHSGFSPFPGRRPPGDRRAGQPMRRRKASTLCSPATLGQSATVSPWSRLPCRAPPAGDAGTDPLRRHLECGSVYLWISPFFLSGTFRPLLRVVSPTLMGSLVPERCAEAIKGGWPRVFGGAGGDLASSRHPGPARPTPC